MSENTQSTEVTFPDLTPYAAMQVVNRVLAANGIDQAIKPQQMYGYARTGRIEVVEGSKPILFVGEAFKVWLDQYVAKQVAGTGTGARQDFDKLAEQFM